MAHHGEAKGDDLVAVDEPQDLTFSAGQRPEGLYAVLHKKHWIGFQVSTFGGADDRFLVQTWGVFRGDMPKWKAIWQSHLAGFHHEFLRHADMPEPGLCGGDSCKTGRASINGTRTLQHDPICCQRRTRS